MRLDDLREQLPEPARDLRLNLGSLLQGGTGLTPRQLWGTALACALAAGEERLIRALAGEARAHLEPGELDAVRSAAALMAMNNVYYRALHLIGRGDYGTMPARLRMQKLAGHGTDPLDFELWCLAVSAVHGCGRCLEAHEATLLDKGARPDTVQDALRVAAVVHAVARTLAAEAALDAALN